MSDEQEAAVQSSSASLVVSAAAGSGKTRVLVERYLKHVIDEGFRADQILTITFTRRAAAEMKRRIVDRLTGLGLNEQAQIAETGPIQTIHGFCERTLRENSIEAGLDPEFQILSEAQAARVLEQSIQEVLAYPPEEAVEAAKLITKLAGQRRFRETFSPHAKLEAAIRDAIHGWRGTGVPLGELTESHLNPVALLAKWRSTLLDRIEPEVRAAFDDIRSGGNFATKLQEAYKEVKKAKPRFIRPSVDQDLESAEDTCGLMQLVGEAWSRFEGKLRNEQMLDFISLEAFTVCLLKQSSYARERLRAQYPIVLVDEAQDLNPVQYELLSAMEPKTEMFVGDHQQSIYGFRQADVKLFAQKLTFSNSARLSKNYRSEEGILGFVDHVFGELWEAGYTSMSDRKQDAYPGVELWMQPQQDKALTAEWIRELVEEMKLAGRRAKDVAILVRFSSYAMDLLKHLVRAGVPARVAGGTEQFYARLEVRDLANALEALTDPYDDFAMAALLRSPFADLSLDSIVLLGKLREEGRRVPIVEGLKSFKPALEADRAIVQRFLGWFEPLSAYADRLAAWELIGELFARTGYIEVLARREGSSQKIANVRKLLSLAAQEAETGPREFAERIREIQAIRHKEGDAPAGDEEADEVTIMTIHKSKGLEFPVIVMPDTHQRLTKVVQDVEVDPGLRLITTKFGSTSSMFHEWLCYERQKREEEEEWRVMYVGLTRAMERLCVVISPNTGGDRIAHRISRLLKLREAPPPGVLIRDGQGMRR